MTGLKPGELSP